MRKLFGRYRVPLVCLAVFLGAVIVHFWPVLLAPASVLYGGPGDHTAGLMWLYDQSNGSPWWHFSPNSAVPWGDQLWDPVYVVSQVSYVSYWAASKLAGGSVAGYNLFSIGAVALSFAVTAAFIYYRLSRRPLVAAAGGYFAAFTTMVLGKMAVGYISFMFGAAYVTAAVWLVLDLFAGRHVWRNAVLLGLLVGSLVYFDPYFVLIVPVVIVAAVGGLVVYELANRTLRAAWRTYRANRVVSSVALAIGVALVVAAPCAAYLHFRPSPGLAGRASVNMKIDAAQYGATLSDYFLPAPYSPVYPRGLIDQRLKTHHGADESYVLFFGYSLVAATVFIWGVLLYQLVGRRDRALMRRPEYRVFLVSTSVFAWSFYFSLPALYKIGGVRIVTPADIITDHTYTWRIFADFDVAVHTALILSVVAGGLLLYRTVLNRRWFVVAAAVTAVVLAAETLPRLPFSSDHFWNYASSLPQTYRTVRDRSETKIIAEYPLREQPQYRGSLYLTAQHYHGKKLFNAYSSSSPTNRYREAVMGLDGPQTLPLLRAFGVDTLIVNQNLAEYPQRVPVDAPRLASAPFDSKFGHELIDVYDIRQGPKYRYMLLVNRNERPRDETQTTAIPYQLSEIDSVEVVDLCRLGVTVALDCRQAVTPTAIRFKLQSAAGAVSITRQDGTPVYDTTTAEDGGIAIPLGDSAVGKYVIKPAGSPEFSITQPYIEQTPVQ